MTTTETQIETILSHYIQAALWSSTDESRDDGGDPLDQNYDASDIDPDALASMRTDCEKFARANAASIALYDGEHGAWEQAGHDFWLTRNGHGVGFWEGSDRGWPGETGKTLDTACKACGECNLYLGDDGKLYII